MMARIPLRKPPAQNTRGSAAVEFAVISPVLFLFLFGTIEFGRLLMVEQCLTNAAREGARLAVLQGATSGQVISRINAYLDSCGIDGESITITPANPSGVDVDQPITITVSVPYASIAWIPGSFAGLDSTVLQTSSVMRKEG